MAELLAELFRCASEQMRVPQTAPRLTGRNGCKIVSFRPDYLCYTQNNIEQNLLDFSLFILCEVKALKQNIENGKRAIIILHEIYGVNKFIQGQCQKFRNAGYDVFCPNLIGKPAFTYDKSDEAYDFFIKNVGFEVYQEISMMVTKLKERYHNLFILGFSVGATIAWRCCENSLCNGIISCYGSRIRDYTHLSPASPTLLLFAKEDYFDVSSLICKLQDKQHLSMIEFDAQHGFLDSFSEHFDFQQSERAEESITRFLNECTQCPL